MEWGLGCNSSNKEFPLTIITSLLKYCSLCSIPNSSWLKRFATWKWTILRRKEANMTLSMRQPRKKTLWWWLAEHRTTIHYNGRSPSYCKKPERAWLERAANAEKEKEKSAHFGISGMPRCVRIRTLGRIVYKLWRYAGPTCNMWRGLEWGSQHKSLVCCVA